MDLKKILNRLQNFARKVVNFQIALLLYLAYFIIILPFGIFVRLFKDYLEIKRSPSWQNRKEVAEPQLFLKKQ